MEYFAKKLLGSSTGVIRKKVIKNEIQSSVHISETRHLICKNNNSYLKNSRKSYSYNRGTHHPIFAKK